MKLAALVRVKFDGDIIEEFVRHTLQFVDRIYVVDNASVDAAPQILQSLIGEGLPVTVWYDDIHEPAPEIMTGYTRRVFKEDGAEYVLLTDADGFVRAPSRAHVESALAGLPAKAHATIPRTTYLPTPRDRDDPRVLARLQYRRTDETPQYSKVIVSRSFMDRPSAEIMPGNHGVTDTKGSSETVELPGVRLAHFPVRSIAQLQGTALLVWSSHLVMGYDMEKALVYKWRRLNEELQGRSRWDPADFYRHALQFLGVEAAEGDLLFDPLPPVELHYPHPVLPVSAVAISYSRQLSQYCVKLKTEATSLAAELTAARSRKVVFLHVGTHKTGSSAIQAMLGTQFETLAKENVYVPLPAGDQHGGVLAVHHAAAIRFAEGVDPNLPFEALLEDLSRSNLLVAVLSSENFETLYDKPDILRRIATKLGFCGYEPRIVIYVRPQASYAESLYAELVKHGLNRSFDAYLETLLAEGAVKFKYFSYCFEYCKLADSFAAAFGRDRVTLRPYKGDQKNDFILRDFLSAISASGNSDIVTQPERPNLSLTYAGVLEELYAHSAHRSANAPTPETLVAMTLAPHERGFLDEKFSILEREDQTAIFNRFGPNNCDLAERYGVELEPEPQSRAAQKNEPRKRLMKAAREHWVLDGSVYAGDDFLVDQDAAWLKGMNYAVPGLTQAAMRIDEKSKRPRGRKIAFLHVGTHKTGTSAIQAMLGTQYETLAKEGIYVPAPSGNDTYGTLALHQEAATRFAQGVEPNLPFETLIEDLRRNDLLVAVLSSENFESLHDKPEVLARIANKLRFAGYEPHIVLYVRDQGSYAESLYAGLVKHGLACSFDSFLEDVLHTGAVAFHHWSYSFQYATLASRFAEAFGREHIIVRAYHSNRPNDFLLRDFLASVSSGGSSDIVTQQERPNRSLTFRGVLTALHRNVQIPLDAPDPEELINEILDADGRAFLDGPFSVLTREDELRIGKGFSAENDRLAEEYGVDLRSGSRQSLSADSPQKRLLNAVAQRWGLNSGATV